MKCHRSAPHVTFICSVSVSLFVNKENSNPDFLGWLLALNGLMVQNAGERLHSLAGLMGGMGLRELCFFFAQLDVRVLFLAFKYWASDAFMCLEFLEESGRKAWTSTVSQHEHQPSHLPRPWETKTRTFTIRHAMVILLPLKKKKRKKITSFSFCATANIATFLAGRGSYFVYVWTRILIDRVSCNPILNYRFSSRLMQQIVSK